MIDLMWKQMEDDVCSVGRVNSPLLFSFGSIPDIYSIYCFPHYLYQTLHSIGFLKDNKKYVFVVFVVSHKVFVNHKSMYFQNIAYTVVLIICLSMYLAGFLLGWKN